MRVNAVKTTDNFCDLLELYNPLKIKQFRMTSPISMLKKSIFGPPTVGIEGDDYVIVVPANKKLYARNGHVKCIGIFVKDIGDVPIYLFKVTEPVGITIDSNSIRVDDESSIMVSIDPNKYISVE